jgi:hypothetical protein
MKPPSSKQQKEETNEHPKQTKVKNNTPNTYKKNLTTNMNQHQLITKVKDY